MFIHDPEGKFVTALGAVLERQQALTSSVKNLFMMVSEGSVAASDHMDRLERRIGALEKLVHAPVRDD